MPLSIVSATVPAEGKYIEVVIGGGTLPLKPSKNISGFVLKINGVAVDFDYADPVGAKLELTLRKPVMGTDTVAYDVDASNLTDSATTPNALANVTAGTVVNNSSLAGDDVNASSIAGNAVDRGDYTQRTGDNIPVSG